MTFDFPWKYKTKKKIKMNLNEQNIKNVIKRDFQSKNPFKQGLNMPKLKSITLHISFKEQKFESKKYLLPAIIGLQIITGQKVKIHKSKKAVSIWRLMKGDYTGVSVVLRGKTMYAFFDNLIELILPSLRPFEGIDTKSLDKQGNLSFTIPNLFVFPQLEREYIHFQQGFNIKGSSGEDFKYLPVEINIATTSKNIEEGKLFFSGLRVPLI